MNNISISYLTYPTVKQIALYFKMKINKINSRLYIGSSAPIDKILCCDTLTTLQLHSFQKPQKQTKQEY